MNASSPVVEFAPSSLTSTSEPSFAGVGCCPTDVALNGSLPVGPLAVPNADPTAFVRRQGNGNFDLSFILESLSCAACVPDIERTLLLIPGVLSARVNLSLSRLQVTWSDPEFDPQRISVALTARGYRATPYDAAVLERLSDDNDKALLRAMAVAGFASANIMLISVSIWSGHSSDMGAATRDFFHWISALIALPTIAYSGRPFFLSAWSALRGGRVNMDVPISLGVLLAALASVGESWRSGAHAYFDAAVMLLFFLLIGRYLDQNMRARTRSVAANLLALRAIGATVIQPDGQRAACASGDLKPGMVVAVVPGDRIPADGIVRCGRSDVDVSLVSGESVPQSVMAGSTVYAGTMALTGALEVEVTSAGKDTLLSQIVTLMENATRSRSPFVALADRAAQWYAPTVHVLAALTFGGWMVLGDGGWHPALMSAVAVLIITCPCALGLAVPAVQTVALGALMKTGTLLKSGEALERMADVDTVVFDKTGTLTLGRPELINMNELDPQSLEIAVRLAQNTRHPLAVALVRCANLAVSPLAVTETPGLGLSAEVNGVTVKLGSREWCDVDGSVLQGAEGESELWLRVGSSVPVRFAFTDQPRPDAANVIAALKGQGFYVEMLSGDRRIVAEALGQALGITTVTAEVKPDGKLARLNELASAGRKVLMVGDGLNDAPSLNAAYASMSPAAAADISQAAADAVFRGDRLAPVVSALAVARASKQRMVENIFLAVIYNVIAVPIAMLGWVTPLIAAIAMSGSSVIVVANALRLSGWSLRSGR